MMETKVRTALVGCGKVGLTHARSLATLPHSRLVAVCDADRQRAELFGRQFGVPAYTDVAEMTRSEKVGMVSVCTPHPTHVGTVEAAAGNGAHALVEKPLAPDLAGCDRSIDACRQAGVKLGVMSQRRWYRPVVRMRRAIDSGAIGTPIIAVATVMGWRDESYYRSDPWRGRWETEGGGVLVNQTPHQLDLLRWFMGPIEELYGYWDNFNHPSIEVEDTALAVIRFKSGALGSLVLSNSQNPGLYGRIHVHGSNGASVGVQTEGGSMFISGVTTEVDPPFNDLWTVAGQEDLLAGWQAEDRAATETEDPLTFYHARQIEEFLDAIIEDRPTAVDGADGRNAVEIFTAVYRSRRDGRPVRFPLDAAEQGSDYDGRLIHPRPTRGTGQVPA
jgi:UDP-N-acetyl-2-amino-2-deoxyglucuronate dehydrogenase